MGVGGGSPSVGVRPIAAARGRRPGGPSTRPGSARGGNNDFTATRRSRSAPNKTPTRSHRRGVGAGGAAAHLQGTRSGAPHPPPPPPPPTTAPPSESLQWGSSVGRRGPSAGVTAKGIVGGTRRALLRGRLGVGGGGGRGEGTPPAESPPGERGVHRSSPMSRRPFSSAPLSFLRSAKTCVKKWGSALTCSILGLMRSMMERQRSQKASLQLSTRKGFSG